MIKKEEIFEGMFFTIDADGFKSEDKCQTFLYHFRNENGDDIEVESFRSKILLQVKGYGAYEQLKKAVFCTIYNNGYGVSWHRIQVQDVCKFGTFIVLSEKERRVLEAVDRWIFKGSDAILREYEDEIDHNVEYALANHLFTNEFCKEHGFMVMADKWVKECEKDLPKAKKDLENIISNKMVGKSYYAEERPLISKDLVRFGMITKKMRDTFERKNKDYGNSFKDLYKECGMTYAYGHLSEKLARIKSLMKDEAKVKGESMKDSLYDLANYAILTIMELERKENDKRKDIHRD